MKGEGLPWCFSGSDSEFPLQRVQVQSLVGEPRTSLPHSVANKKGRGRHRNTGKMMEAEIRMMHQHAKKWPDWLLATPEAEKEVWNRFSPQERTWSCLHPTSDSRPSNCERMSFCFLKPPRLWYFITAALTN